MKNILITGATGTIGSELVNLLSKEPTINLKIAVRNLNKATFDLSKSVAFDFEKHETFTNALDNVESVFVLPPVTPTMAETVGKFLQSIKSSKVKSIVYLSGLNASVNGKGFDKLHGDTVEILKQTEIPYTIIEPVEFMKNYLPFIENPSQNSIMQFAQANTKKSLIAHQDIAEIVAKSLVNGQHNGQRLQISGYDYNNYELADILTKMTNRKISYQPISFDQYNETYSGYGLPKWLVDCLIELNKDIIEGKNLISNQKAVEFLGRQPLTFEKFVEIELATKI